jgi:hypothetical protein
MNDRFKELAAILGIIGMIVVGFHSLMEWSGLPAYIGTTYGEPIKILYWVVSTLVLIGFSAQFLHKYELLGAGAEPAETSLRDDFDALRANLAEHHDSEDAYATRLKKFLAWVDAFFQEKSEPTQRALLLRELAHLWTASALDRCLQLALIYPVTTIFVVWAISGEANGPVEQALKLNAADGPHRLMATASIVSMFFAYWWMSLSKGWHRIGWMLVA